MNSIVIGTRVPLEYARCQFCTEQSNLISFVVADVERIKLQLLLKFT
jgi:hypothetical protein